MCEQSDIEAILIFLRKLLFQQQSSKRIVTKYSSLCLLQAR